MSIHRRAARRDANEPEIVKALEAVGATVERLSGDGVPDLLVGFRGESHLLECKLPLGLKGGTSHRTSSRGGKGDMTKPQVDWHAAWRGRPVVVVRSAEEALRAIGAVVFMTAKTEVPACVGCGAPLNSTWAHASNCLLGGRDA